MSEEKPNGNVDRYRIDQLEILAERLTTRIEESNKANWQELKSLRSAIGEMHTAILMASKNECPSPGACIGLQGETRDIWKQIELIKKWQQATEKKFAWVMGAVAVATPVITLAASYVVNHLIP